MFCFKHRKVDRDDDDDDDDDVNACVSDMYMYMRTHVQWNL